MSVPQFDWTPYLRRLKQGEWRSILLRDMILADIVTKSEMGVSRPTVLDIGCGHGFDNNSELQKSLAESSGSYIGVEPDHDIEPQPIFTDVYRCFFEDAPIAANSVDIAFAVMVLEHVLDPQAFWDKVNTVLRKGGGILGTDGRFTSLVRGCLAPYGTFAFERLVSARSTRAEALRELSDILSQQFTRPGTAVNTFI